jgi:hypothetical protein
VASQRERASGAADAAIDRIRQLNERIMERLKQRGETTLEAYERTLLTIADYQDAAGKRGSEWVAGMAKAQAAFTRELASASPAAARAVRSRMEELSGAATRQARKVPGEQNAEGTARGTVAREQDLPIANYDKLSAADVAKRARRLSKVDRGKVEAYERRHKNRKTVLEAVGNS